MRLLRTLELDALPPEALETLKLRQAARAVVFDREGNVALLHVRRDGYYKLPGGGVEAGEDVISTLKRECLEEIGCAIEVEREIGMTVEYKSKSNTKQESYCYLANVTGPKGTPDLSEGERACGFSTLQVPLAEAIKLVSEANTEDRQRKFIVPRELVLLREAEKLSLIEIGTIRKRNQKRVIVTLPPLHEAMSHGQETLAARYCQHPSAYHKLIQQIRAYRRRHEGIHDLDIQKQLET